MSQHDEDYQKLGGQTPATYPYRGTRIDLHDGGTVPPHGEDSHADPLLAHVQALAMTWASRAGTRGEQIRQLRDALDRYGVHQDWCFAGRCERCNCGLRAALTIGEDMEAK